MFFSQIILLNAHNNLKEGESTISILQISFFIRLLIQQNFVVIVQSINCIQLFVTPWTAACQTLLSCTVSQSLLKFMSIESGMLSNHLILYCPPFLMPSIFPSIRVFSNEFALPIRWPKYWSSRFSKIWRDYSGPAANGVEPQSS